MRPDRPDRPERPECPHGLSRRLRLVAGGSLVLLLGLAAPLHAQSNLRNTFLNLFTFGNCGQPLCLSVDAGRHEKHFIPSVVAGAGDLLGFLTNAVGTSLNDVPMAAASGGTTFMFTNGTPVATSTSAGPIFGERAPTLGRGRWFVSANATGASYKSIRGMPLSDLNLTFTHQNVADSALGSPAFENDMLNVSTGVAVNMLVSSVVVAYGLLDRVDLAVAVPFVRASVSGHSTATIVSAGTGIDSLAHFFGPVTNKQLSTSTSSSGVASGVGDVVARVKINAVETPSVGFSLMAGARFATGNKDEFLGTGATDIMGMGILSGKVGTFSPHLNLGYLHRGADFENSAVLATAGFDNLIGRRTTLALDLITGWQVGTSKLLLPAPVKYTAPITRTVNLTDIPAMRGNLIDAAVGAKIAASNRLNLVVNSLLPVNRAGVRANAVWTLGAEYNFYPHRTAVVSAP